MRWNVALRIRWSSAHASYITCRAISGPVTRRKAFEDASVPLQTAIPRQCTSVGSLDVSKIRVEATGTVNALVTHPASTACLREPCSVLRDFLRPPNLSSPTPVLHTPDTLMDLYASCKAGSRHTRLDLSSLIKFFGGLSALSQGITQFVFPLHPLACRTHERHDTSCTYWPFVLQLVQDKESLGQTLYAEESYWATMACLHSIDITRLPPSDPRLATAVSQARAYYIGLHRRSGDASLHEHYLEALLMLRTDESLDELVQHVSRLLRSQTKCSPELIQILWRTVLLPGAGCLSRVRRAKLLEALFTRVLRVRVSGPLRTLRGLVSIRDLNQALIDVICHNHPSQFSSASELHRWARAQARALLSPRTPLAIRWSQLTIIAAANAPLANRHVSDNTASPKAHRLASSWQTVCALSALEVALAGSNTLEPSHDLTGHIRHVIHVLWQQWVQAGEVERPSLIAQTIVTSFFRFAARTQDAEWHDACRRYCDSHKLWADPSSTRVQGLHLCATYVGSAVACYGGQWPRIFGPIIINPDLRWVSDIISICLPRLLRNNLSLAHSLYTYALDIDVPIHHSDVYPLAMELAYAGHIDHAVPFLSRTFSSPSQLRRLLEAVLRSLPRSQSRRVSHYTASILSETMLKVYSQALPPMHMQWAFGRVLRVLACSGCAEAAVSITRAIYAQSPLCLTTNCLWQLLRALLTHRHFRLACSLLEIATTSTDASATRGLPRLRRALILGLFNAGASNLALRYSRFPPARASQRFRTIAIAHALRYRRPSPSSRVLPLKVLPLIAGSEDDPYTTHFALRVLMRAGRPNAAKRLLERTYTRYKPAWRTSMLNVLLHGTLLAPSPRNRQRVKKLLWTLSTFCERYDFVPDRVTVNILLKALIQWTNAVDAQSMRALFDHLVRSGYPGGEGPFGTPAPPTHPLLQARLSPHITFFRHARPIYKLFIRGFTQRGDVEAARKVLAILRAEEYRHWGPRMIEPSSRRRRRTSSIDSLEGRVTLGTM